jgi:HD-GYP domain-containing protein (c-di-GMP phosphodiesterase class II)
VVYELVERRVLVRDLEVGMYICRLDRSWHETPFPLQGLAVHSDADIEAVGRYCEYVFVDTQRDVAADIRPQVLRRTEPSPVRFRRSQVYQDTARFDDELARAGEAFDNASACMEEIVDAIVQGQVLDIEVVARAVRPMVDSVMRSGDAFFWIESLRRRDSYTYQHAVSCSALAAAFGRHMGFDQETIVSLAAGNLLMDVGKSQLPDELLLRAGPLDAQEMALARLHVEEGLGILAHSGVMDVDVRDIVGSHHERFDGGGYPQGLAGAAIPLAARMAAIIDTYDALCTPRPYREAVSRHHALREIYAGRDSAFQGELVEQFQSCLGVYPTGSLVELTSGEIAIVMVQNHARRLLPRVAVLTTREKAPLDDFRIVDLMRQVGHEHVEVGRSLPPGSHGIDPKEFFLQ